MDEPLRCCGAPMDYDDWAEMYYCEECGSEIYLSDIYGTDSDNK